MIYLFTYFGLRWVFAAEYRLSLVAESRGYSPVRVCGLLIAMTSLVADSRLKGSQASIAVGSVAVAHGFSCPTVCGIFPDQGLNLCPLCWQADS